MILQLTWPSFILHVGCHQSRRRRTLIVKKEESKDHDRDEDLSLGVQNSEPNSGRGYFNLHSCSRPLAQPIRRACASHFLKAYEATTGEIKLLALHMSTPHRD